MLTVAMTINTRVNTGTLPLLTRLSRQIYKRTSEDLLGLRLRHYVALSYLRDVDHAPQQLMCDIFGVDANNMVLLLNSLEELGYVARRRDPNDRRRHLVELTDAGREALERAELAQRAMEDEFLAALSSDERDTLQDLLARALAGALGAPRS
jgi:DNA-binding MarR family transcriptional regulator